MSKPKQHHSPIMAAIHETAKDLRTAGLMGERTMHKFDETCLTSEFLMLQDDETLRICDR
jgi:DNA-binding transcriptional regulator YiaG